MRSGQYTLLLLVFLFITSCVTRPEDLIIGDWNEVEWDYEKFDGFSPKDFKKIDGINLRNYSDRNLIRHEAEIWTFHPDGTIELKEDNGEVITKARWLLKGRGHILKIRYDEKTFELYDVKRLTEDEMTLHYDIGMEVRGIAKLGFERNKKEE